MWLFQGFLFVLSDERKMKYLGCVELHTDCIIEPPTQSDKTLIIFTGHTPRGACRYRLRAKSPTAAIEWCVDLGDAVPQHELPTTPRQKVPPCRAHMH